MSGQILEAKKRQCLDTQWFNKKMDLTSNSYRCNINKYLTVPMCMKNFFDSKSYKCKNKKGRIQNEEGKWSI